MEWINWLIYGQNRLTTHWVVQFQEAIADIELIKNQKSLSHYELAFAHHIQVIAR